ncbi:putative malonate decarboxylase [Pseudomonas aeruginosa]|nr:putative malonate decarboxylase [Pseudomonas aeruginosa]AWF69641.1 putative malonate decarboxylase [Pseudomonas aeruginosa]OKR44858.1 malonate decarboxylase [Pseudomonas aeruginosa]PRW12206.1 putative malonate decarboxylase [Pseudomonas aeruginosa]BAQ36870.1 malonate decarboxylase [Pseudomonas aeruginosa]
MPRSKSWGSGPALRRIGSGASRRRLEPSCELFAMTTARS